MVDVLKRYIITVYILIEMIHLRKKLDGTGEKEEKYYRCVLK